MDPRSHNKKIIFSLLTYCIDITRIIFLKFLKMSENQNQDFKMKIEPEVIVSESEEEEFLPVYGPLPEPYQGPIPCKYHHEVL